MPKKFSRDFFRLGVSWSWLCSSGNGACLDKASFGEIDAEDEDLGLLAEIGFVWV